MGSGSDDIKVEVVTTQIVDYACSGNQGNNFTVTYEEALEEIKIDLEISSYSISPELLDTEIKVYEKLVEVLKTIKDLHNGTTNER